MKASQIGIHIKEISVSFFGWIEDLWVKYYWIISSLLGVGTGLLYYFGMIKYIRNTLGNVITFASIIIGVLGIFLTLLITLEESPIFARLRENFPLIQKRLFLWLRSQLWVGILIVLCSIIITMVPNPSNKLICAIGLSVWGTFFWLMSIGSFYTVKLVTDLIVGNFGVPKRSVMK